MAILGNKDNKNGKKAPMGAAQMLRFRTGVIIAIILIVGFGASILRLGMLTTVQSAELQEAAVGQQLKDTEISAKRGTIYDVNGKVIAESASVWQVVMAPAYFEKDEQRVAAAQGLSRILGLEYDNVYKKTQGDSYYIVVKRRIESDQREQVLKLIEELEDKYDCGNVIQLIDDYKRYYPMNDLASCVIGFTGSDDQGLEGVEYKYDDYLAGTPGRIVTAKNSAGTDMPFQYEQAVEAEDGYNLTLTIDSTVQAICEKYMKQAIVDNGVMNRAVCVAMDVNTGAIIAMCTVGGYDLNDPYTLPKEQQDEIAALPEKEQDAAESKALAAMWRNKAVSDTYMPGSVFKMCTGSMAIEENVVDEKSSFVCGGAYTVAGETMACSNTAGHGVQNFQEAMINSCNPAFMQIGQLIGMKKFRAYYEGFGFADRTGIDLPGEGDDSFWPEETMNEVNLATASFGQNFKITPIQMITACSAVANGGYVLQPYVVSQITDSEGHIIKTNERIVKRQVISKETSDKLNEVLGAYTGITGSGYVAGYKTAGKTGTSEKIDVKKPISSFEKDYVASFCGYAPSDDPKIAMLVFLDTPSGGAYYGSQIAAPVFSSIMSEVLPYLEIKTDYSEEDLAYVNVSAGSYTGLDVESATSKVENDGFTAIVKGSGDKVVSQIPAVGSSLANAGSIVLYTDTESQSDKVEVPDLTGYSAGEVNIVASSYGLNASFVAAASSGVVSKSQDIPAGTQVSPGTIITVTFSSASSVNE